MLDREVWLDVGSSWISIEFRRVLTRSDSLYRVGMNWIRGV